ncbi:MAG TPA: hypothetical protein VFG86_17740 [Chloroflexota bacterium]|jgi:F0F1-type ATP synthase membrane subunit c/vacuolar-type H+-ATPase subunit K|nr:hypothetical protein [Chloroflexota bacterium]
MRHDDCLRPRGSHRASGTTSRRPRLIWVAPLTLIAALAVNFGIKLVVQAIHPSLARMPQLESPMVTLTVLGTAPAIVAFVIVGLVTRRPFFWYPIVAGVALLLSWIPDIMLGMGGQTAFTAMRIVGPLTSLGQPGPGGGGPPPGPRPGGPPPGGGGGFTTPIEQVLVLMLLHLATAVVCVVMLTVLMRKRTEVS